MIFTIAVGWFTLLGALIGLVLPAVPVVLLYAKYKSACAHGPDATRSEVHAVFALAGVQRTYAERDWTDETGQHHKHWGHRLQIFTLNVGPSILSGALVGLLIDNIAQFI